MVEFETTVKADSDLESIFEEGLQRWGWDQAVNYSGQLFNAFRTLSEQPHIGTKANYLAENLLKFPVGSHWVYYKPKGYRIQIVRVLKQIMDVNVDYFVD
ncbi:MAG: type II toxin-antitoxin system RelE/ParE family toxin [Pseudomonadota bacterium]